MLRPTSDRLARWIQSLPLRLGAAPAPLLASAGGGDFEPSGRGRGATGGRPRGTESPVEPPPSSAPENAPGPPAPRGDGDDDASEDDLEALASEALSSAVGQESPAQRGLAGRFKKGIVSMVASSYDARADDLDERAVRAMRRALVDERSHIMDVAREMYDAHADDLQSRAVATLQRVIENEHQRMLEFAQSTYDSRADDLEERAVRAMRVAIQREADRIESLIEHSVDVKRREVRLSLLVLVAANLIYLAVYWATKFWS
jgi:signal transduction histidine kinase